MAASKALGLRTMTSLTSILIRRGAKRRHLSVSVAIGFVAFPRESGGELKMNAVFRRQLADYVEFHRDPTNGVMHVFGIIFLFLGAVLPLSLWPVTLFGVGINAAAIMAVPALIYWILLDTALGLGILGAAILLLLTAAAIATHTSVATVWMISIALLVVGVALQLIGHQVFEKRRPSLMDNPAHLFLGPMFVMAKLYIALGFRNDLAVIIERGSPSVARRPSLHLQRDRGDARQEP